MRPSIVATASLLTLAALMSACGGSGGGAAPADPPVSVDPPTTSPPPPPAPQITEQPQAQSVAPGTTAIFRVGAAAASASSRYQWLRNGVAIAGATSDTHAVPNVQCAQSAEIYSVEVANESGIAYSAQAQLSVVPCGIRVLTGNAFAYEPGPPDGPGEQVRLGEAGAVRGYSVPALGAFALAPGGRLLFADRGTWIREFASGGQVRKLAGVPDYSQGAPDTPARQAALWPVEGLAVDAQGQIFIADAGQHVIRKIGADGIVRLHAGEPGQSWPTRFKGSVDGVGRAAGFSGPGNLAIDAAANLYTVESGVVDPNVEVEPPLRGGGGAIRKIGPGGEVSTLGYLPELIRTALGAPPPVSNLYSIRHPAGIARDAAGNLYISQPDRHMVWKLGANGRFAALAGTPDRAGAEDGPGAQARFFRPGPLGVDAAGNLYVADRGNHSIRRIDAAGTVSTVAGKGTPSFADGIGRAAGLQAPNGIASASDGTLYVLDSGNHRVRRITPQGVVSTLAGDGSPNLRPGALPGQVTGLAGIALASTRLLYVASHTAVLRIELP